MSTETAVAVWQPPPPPTPAEWEATKNAAVQFAKSDLVKPHFRGKPENVCLALITGRDLGLPWTIVLQKGFVVDGKFDLEVDVKVDLVRRNLPGFDFEVIEQTEEKCVIRGGVKGRNLHTIEFTYEQAKLAGYTAGRDGEKQNWRPGRRGDMLLARCLARLLKRTGGLYASLINSLDADAVDDLEQPVATPPTHEPSVATVVETPAAGASPTPDAQPQAGPVETKDVPVDWKGRLLNGVAEHYMIAARPPSTAQGRARWARTYGDHILKVVNLYYADRGEKPIASWNMFPSDDFERVAVWLEAHIKNNKSAGSGVPEATVEQDAPPAPESPGNGPAEAYGASGGAEDPQAVPEDDAPPPDDREAPPLTMAAPTPTRDELILDLATKPLDDVLRIFDIEFRPKFKGARRFYEKQNDRPYLVDAAWLSDLGYARNQWLDTLWGKEADRLMLSRLIVHERGAK